MFVRFVLVWIRRFPLPPGVWEGPRFVCGTPWSFLLPFFENDFTDMIFICRFTKIAQMQMIPLL